MKRFLLLFFLVSFFSNTMNVENLQAKTTPPVVVNDFQFGYNEGYRFAYTNELDKSTFNVMLAQYQYMLSLYGNSGINFTARIHGLHEGWYAGEHQYRIEHIDMPDPVWPEDDPVWPEDDEI